MLIDTTRCRNCERCVAACHKTHRGSDDGTPYMNLTMIHGREQERNALTVPMHCLHCDDPACVAVCEGRALRQTALGAVVVDQSHCIECLSCVNTCPFHMTLRYSHTNHKVFKCDMCYDRISQEGGKPACVEACELKGHNALLFGPYDEIVQAAQQRASEVDGVLLYPGSTSNLVLFSKDEFKQPAIQELFGLTEQYPQASKVKATVTRVAHLGWLPVIGGLGVWVLNWRQKRIEGLATRKEGKQP